MAARAGLAAAWLGALLWWGMLALLLARPVGTSATSSDGGATVIHAVYWRPGPGWAGVGFIALVVAAMLLPAGVLWLGARGRRWAVAAVGLGVLALSFVAFLLPPMPAALCWLVAGIWPGPAVRRGSRLQVP